MQNYAAPQAQSSTRSRELMIGLAVFAVVALAVGGALLMRGGSHAKPAAAAAAPVTIEGTMTAHTSGSITVATAHGPENFALKPGVTTTPYSEVLAIAAQSDTPTVQLTYRGADVVSVQSEVQALEALPHVSGYVTSANDHSVTLQVGTQTRVFTIAPADLPTIDVRHLVVEHIPDHVLTTVYYSGTNIKMYLG